MESIHGKSRAINFHTAFVQLEGLSEDTTFKRNERSGSGLAIMRI